MDSRTISRYLHRANTATGLLNNRLTLQESGLPLRLLSLALWT